jgi:glutamate-ammonia-ligase adenylyltransferase
MDPAFLTEQLENLCRSGDESGLADIAKQLGFREVRKSAANLLLLFEALGDCRLLAGLAVTALDSAAPDQALNGLERLAKAPLDTLLAILEDERVRRALLTVLGASPFLTNILCRRSELLADLFRHRGIDRSKDENVLIEELRSAIPDPLPLEELQRRLRLFKQQEILRIAARDLCGLADLAETAGELAALAAASLQRAYEVCDDRLRSEFGAPVVAEETGEPAGEAEFTVLGMGKLGGRELNFSSDIDLIYCYSSDQGQTAGIPDTSGRICNRISVHQYFVKLAEQINKAISQVTAEGFVFRVDMRLRPEGRSGEIANSMLSTEFYYENWGQSWERSAMLKARPVAGSLDLGDRLLKNLEPFIYRKYLDYTMIEDLKVMKQKIDRNLTREREGELNLKLGRGGIREIEFFIQAMQLVHAGKHPALREKNSLRALALLQSEGLIDADSCSILSQAYIFLRTVEHRIQVVQERQTHNLPTDPLELDLLGRRCGFADGAGFRKVLEDYRRNVTGIYHDLFYTSAEEAEAEVPAEIARLFDAAADSDLVKDELEARGFRDPDRAYDNLLTLRDGPPHQRLSQQTRRHLDRIAPLLLLEVLESPDPDMAFANLERFVCALRARATFFALLAENRWIIKLLVSLFGTSQFLSQGFIQHPEILDALVSGSQARKIKNRAELQEDLEKLFRQAPGYEEQLDVLRRFRNEEFLRIALNDLQGGLSLRKNNEQLSLLAEVCLEKARQMARQALLPRYGLPFCRNAAGKEHEAAFAIVGMDKLGGREITYHSALDIIFIYEDDGQTRPAPETEAESFRPLSNQEYFARLAQRIISILTLMTREGIVYPIDTRLRPSGTRGPLVTSLNGFRKYHEQSIQLWERQALIRARVVSGPENFTKRIAEDIERIVYARPLPADHRQVIFQLRQRLEEEAERRDHARLNIKTGRGGLVDVEFLVQYLQLLHGGDNAELRKTNTLAALKTLRRENLLQNGEYVILASGYQFLRRLENRLRLVHDQSIHELSGDPAYLAKLARRLGYRGENLDRQLLDRFRQVTNDIRTVFDRYLGSSEPI